MSKKMLLIVTVVLAVLVAVPGAFAQGTAQDVIQSYYAELEQAVVSGGATPALLDLFADDATIILTALSPDPVQGKEAIQTVFASILPMLQGLKTTMGDVTIEGETLTVNYTLTVASTEGAIPATDTFVIRDGKIQSLKIDIAPEALAGTTAGATPATLPTSGGPGVLFPALLVLGGAALATLSRRVAR
ncbi:MAG: nuclear transport factor 2 family protein [Anaerolineae bacterium]|nr:nuclear transport factor 2 family protein [Anaerolineae bacterium]